MLVSQRNSCTGIPCLLRFWAGKQGIVPRSSPRAPQQRRAYGPSLLSASRPGEQKKGGFSGHNNARLRTSSHSMTVDVSLYVSLPALRLFEFSCDNRRGRTAIRGGRGLVWHGTGRLCCAAARHGAAGKRVSVTLTSTTWIESQQPLTCFVPSPTVRHTGRWGGMQGAHGGRAAQSALCPAGPQRHPSSRPRVSEPLLPAHERQAHVPRAFGRGPMRIALAQVASKKKARAQEHAAKSAGCSAATAWMAYVA